MSQSERRRAERFYAKVPVELKQGRAFTRDFSTDGVYFVTDQPFSVGEQIAFVLKLDHRNPLGPIQLHCEGEVVRLESENHGVAVAISTRKLGDAHGKHSVMF